MCLTLLYFNFYFIFLLFVFSKLKCKILQENVVDNWQGMHIFRQDSGSYHLVFFFINHSLLRKTILWNILSQGKYITWYWRFFFSTYQELFLFHELQHQMSSFFLHDTIMSSQIDFPCFAITKNEFYSWQIVLDRATILILIWYIWIILQFLI